MSGSGGTDKDENKRLQKKSKIDNILLLLLFKNINNKRLLIVKRAVNRKLLLKPITIQPSLSLVV